MSLLQKALEVAPRTKPDPKADPMYADKVELALAYFTGQVTAAQAAAALGIPSSSLNGILSSCILSGIRTGTIKASLNGNH